MRIAVLGAGFCGIAIAWNLVQQKGIEVTVFDPQGIGGGTSGIAAGLLHPFVGAHSKLNWLARDGVAETKKLLDVAANALGKPVAYPIGMTRLATTPQQISDFSTSAGIHNDVHWHSQTDYLKSFSYLQLFPGIFIESAITVDCKNYLEGLWKACNKLGASFERLAISSLQQMAGFDCTIVAMGAATTSLPELSHLPIRPTKGQILELSWPKQLSPFPHPLNSQAYLLMHPLKDTCIAGATFEKAFSHSEPELKTAKSGIYPKIKNFFPGIEELTILDCRAGIRAGTPDRRPLIKKIGNCCWVLSGMGSKGLLYHALFAKELVDQVLKPT